MKRLYLLFLTLCLPLWAEHQLVYMISGPRSTSVAFMRMMEARGDFEIFHEPSQWAFDKIHYYELCKDWFRPEAPQTFEEVKAELFGTLEHRSAFAKEMSFAVYEFLLADEGFCSDPRVRFVFLLRHPKNTAISFYRKQGAISMLGELVGLKQLWEIYEQVSQFAIHPPIILFSDEVLADPEISISNCCDQLGIAFLPESLSWEPLPESFDGATTWHEIKYPEYTQLWHGEAIRSSGFGPATQHSLLDIEDLDDRAFVQKAVEENLPYYELFREPGSSRHR